MYIFVRHAIKTLFNPIVICFVVKSAICVRAPTSASSSPQLIHNIVIVFLGNTIAPLLKLGARSIQSGGQNVAFVRPSTLQTFYYTRHWAWSSLTSIGLAYLKTIFSNAASRGSSKCSITSTSAAASKPSMRLSR